MAIPKNWTSITTSTVTHMNKIESQKNSKHWNVQFQYAKRGLLSHKPARITPFLC